MKSKKKYAILGCGEFWDINYFDYDLEVKHLSRNFRKVQEVRDTLQSHITYVKFAVVKIKKVKATD